MWRPEGWENINPEYGRATTNDYLWAIGKAYEAGADAMLEALKKEWALYIDLSPNSLSIVVGEHKRRINGRGTLVFVPEEKDD